MYTAGKRAGRQTVAAQLSDFTCKWKPHTLYPSPPLACWFQFLKDRRQWWWWATAKIKKRGKEGTLMT